ncbi:hypothetical protein SAMN06265365_1526 [Tistlia consotensis]|uniref:DUF1440 domain-containing protein n=1 Tax=Tistlia consotensis USBA 355 TaxID=560819 RepID=A0A1Y6CS51_9PROT|nr:DUF6789 family protein [Tistlia consotensis]SMF83996.1 hypothetical protein SAMN05428998_15214 [Tistlia consotensis USBA 355]SNS34969.1 hypothetical protein SAMN06265365_1526 [Tistlia consotensis]
MNVYTRGMISGFFATVALSLLMMIKSKMGMIPEFDIISMLGAMAGHVVGVTDWNVGWLLHFLIGTLVWGPSFARLHDRLPGTSSIMRGVVFGVLAWLLMMGLLMPMAGAGFFGRSLGVVAPSLALVLHLEFGTVLGLAYGRLGTLRHLSAGGVGVSGVD